MKNIEAMFDFVDYAMALKNYQILSINDYKDLHVNINRKYLMWDLFLRRNIHVN